MYVYVLFVAKPVDNLALLVLRRYYAKLCKVLSGCPNEVATQLYSAGLITKQEKRQVVDTLGLDPFRKADILMGALERRLVVENNAVPLAMGTFCHLFQRGYGIDRIVARMKSQLGECTSIHQHQLLPLCSTSSAYVEQHHKLPDDGWSSDPECEQEASSPSECSHDNLSQCVSNSLSCHHSSCRPVASCKHSTGNATPQCLPEGAVQEAIGNES